MRTVLPLCGGGDGGESRGLRSRVGRMRKRLFLRPSHCVDVHMDSEPGVWLRSFQLLDADGQCEVSYWLSDIIGGDGYSLFLKMGAAAAALLPTTAALYWLSAI